MGSGPSAPFPWAQEPCTLTPQDPGGWASSPAPPDQAPPPRTLLPKLIPSGVGREWLERHRAAIRPWGAFVDQRCFSRPRNLGELCQRLVRNVEYYQSNYVFVFLGLIVYCV